MSVSHLLVDVADWMRNVPSGDHGRFAESLVLLQAAVPIRIQIASAGDKVVGGQERTEATHTVYSEPDAAFLRDDLLFINGVRYKVLSKEPPSLPHHCRWKVQAQQNSDGSTT